MKTLKQFYRELQAWIDDGCPEHDVFKTYRPLCNALLAWTDDTKTLCAEMGKSFLDAGLCAIFPFTADTADWSGEIRSRAVYQNPARLAWIKEHAA